MSTAHGMPDENKREMIADFLSESEEHVQTLNSLLLKAEELLKRSEDISSEQVNMMFRAAHTIKGSSSMLGFDHLSHLTHEMETVLDHVRNKKITLTVSVVEVLFTAFDNLNTILEQLRTKGEDDVDIKGIIDQMKLVLSPSVTPSKTIQTESEPEKSQNITDMNRYLPVFLEDTEACVNRFIEILLSFEKDNFNQDQLNEIFRLAHTIKGSSGIIHCKGIESVAHRMEDLLADLRAKASKPNADVNALLFRGIDWIKNALDGLRKGTYQEYDLTSFLKQFELLRTMPQDPLSTLSQDVKVKVIDALRSDHAIYKIVISLTGKSMKDIKAAIIEERLKKTGSVLLSIPRLDNIPECKDDLMVHILYAATSPIEKVRGLLSLDEVKPISINMANYPDLQTHLLPSDKVNEDFQAQGRPDKADTIIKKGAMEITTMKVDARKLDNLMNLAGELVITRARFAQLILEFGNSIHSKEVEGNIYNLSEATSALGKLSSDIQSAVMQTRMVPVEVVFSRFKRLVRDLSKEQDKEINLEFYGEETELDKKVIDSLPDPLTHMIRNAIDHGIESQEERIAAGKKPAGTIQLKAIHQGSSIYIEIIDDGRGLNTSKLAKKALEKGLVTQEKLDFMSEKDKLNFIFLPGFSTAEKITDLSGRGVGMDVVKKTVESLNGSVEIETEIGEGSRFILKIPLTLAIIQALLVTIGDQVFAFPLEDVSEVIKISPEDIYSIDASPMIKLRGHALSLLSMAKILGIHQDIGKIEVESKVVIVGINGEYFAIKVDGLIGEDEIVIKAFPDYFSNVKGISGASILGNGDIALILDVSTILSEV